MRLPLILTAVGGTVLLAWRRIGAHLQRTTSARDAAA